MSTTKRSSQEPSSEEPEAKRSCQEEEEDEEDSECSIYIVSTKLSSGHVRHLKNVAGKKGFKVMDSFSDEVTHLVTALPTYQRLLEVLHQSVSASVEVVSVQWLTDSFIEGRPIQVTDRYRLKKIAKPLYSHTQDPKKDRFQVTEYECQRPTPLKHHNHHISEALELLERYHQFQDYRQGDTRALAFRQASCTIKSLPWRVMDVDEVADLHRIGKHSRRVIEEILEKGSSQEVEDCKQNEWFQCMECFTAVYGCGPATADKWYHQGLRTIQDVEESSEISLTETQKLGIQYYKELSQPITHDETTQIISFLQAKVEECCPQASVEAVGGYRRGKSHGHDVDLLLSHEEAPVALSLLETVMHRLRSEGVVIHADMTIGQNTLTQVQHTHKTTPSHATAEGRSRRKVMFDHLDKAFCILKLPLRSGGEQEVKEKIRRVDLIVSPPEQYPFALVSWTGSKAWWTQFSYDSNSTALSDATRSRSVT